MKKVIMGIGILLLAGGFLLVIATAGSSDFGLLTFRQIAGRGISALAMMVSGYGMLKFTDG